MRGDQAMSVRSVVMRLATAALCLLSGAARAHLHHVHHHHHHHHHHLHHPPLLHHHHHHHHQHQDVHPWHGTGWTARAHQDPGAHLFSTPLVWAGGRAKRALPQLAAARLAADPHVRLNLIGTIDNLKDATKDVLEHGDSPLYHVREAIGSARDVLFSVIKLSPTGLLIPTTYHVAQLGQPPPDTVAAVNPALLAGDGEETGGHEETLKAVQGMLREGVRGARDSAQHVGDTVHSVRRAVLTAPLSALRLLLPYARALELEAAPPPGTGPLLRATAAQPARTNTFLGAGKLLELMRAVASSDTSAERVAAPSPCAASQPATKPYRNLIHKIKKDLADRLNRRSGSTNQL